MKLPNAHQIKELDAYTIQEENILSVELMERAADRALMFIKSKYADKQRPIIIFSGPGNNGGDGLALARLLHEDGYTDIQAYLFNTNNSLTEDCQKNAERLKDECPEVKFTEVQQQFEAPELSKEQLIIDALFGTGLNKPLGGGYAALIRLINGAQTDVISLDMPSGLMCEDNTYNSPSAIVRATFTLTMGLPKLALILADNQVYTGKVYVLDICLNAQKIKETNCPYEITEFQDIQAMLKTRPAYGHKGTFGNALLIAGKHGMAGAAVLAAKACLKAGVGKVTVHTPERNNDILQIAVPEAVLHLDEDDKIFSNTVRNEGFQAMAIGPGIGTDKRTALAFIEQTSHTDTPLLIDADGINILGGHKGWISQIPANTIFTPHPKEMQHLGICNTDSYSTLLEAMNMARQHHFYICLKGHYTAVCTPEGMVYFNSTGNSGMATAGSGDVLTGIILAFMAQQYAPEQACRLGVYLHGLAGDFASADLGEHSVTATDIINYIPAAFQKLKEETYSENLDLFKEL